MPPDQLLLLSIKRDFSYRSGPGLSTVLLMCVCFLCALCGGAVLYWSCIMCGWLFTHTQACMHARTHTHSISLPSLSLSHTQTHAHTHTRAHTHTHTHTHTYTQTHTHTTHIWEKIILITGTYVVFIPPPTAPPPPPPHKRHATLLLLLGCLLHINHSGCILLSVAATDVRRCFAVVLTFLFSPPFFSLSMFYSSFCAMYSNIVIMHTIN